MISRYHRVFSANFFISGILLLTIASGVAPIFAQQSYTSESLFIALLFLEATDIIFAVDSVPAIFALTNEPLIVFTSNIFAILGLRSMYFMLSGAVDKFHLLKYGLSVVLIFVGLKMVWLNDFYGGKFPISYSLGFILGTIAISIAASLIFAKKPKHLVKKASP